jgi:hypothetical protein
LFVRVFVCLLYVHLSALFACLLVCLYRCPSVCLLSLASIAAVQALFKMAENGACAEYHFERLRDCTELDLSEFNSNMV